MKTEVAEVALWGIFTVGGLTLAACEAGPMQQSALQIDDFQTCESTPHVDCEQKLQTAIDAYKWEHALLWGGVVLGVGGLRRLYQGTTESTPEASRS